MNSKGESPHSRDYIERTIATVRNHADSDNSWPQWANVFADEIERLWSVEEQFDALARAVEAWDATLSSYCDGPERDAVRAALPKVSNPANEPKEVA